MAQSQLTLVQEEHSVIALSQILIRISDEDTDASHDYVGLEESDLFFSYEGHYSCGHLWELIGATEEQVEQISTLAPEYELEVLIREE